MCDPVAVMEDSNFRDVQVAELLLVLEQEVAESLCVWGT